MLAAQFINLNLNFQKSCSVCSRISNCTNQLPCCHPVCFNCFTSDNSTCVLCSYVSPTVVESPFSSPSAEFSSLTPTNISRTSSVSPHSYGSNSSFISCASPGRGISPLPSIVSGLRDLQLAQEAQSYGHCTECCEYKVLTYRCTFSHVLCEICCRSHMLSCGRSHIAELTSDTPIPTFSPAVGTEIKTLALQNRVQRSPSPTGSDIQEKISCGHNLSNQVLYCSTCSRLICHDCHFLHPNHIVLSLQGSQELFNQAFKTHLTNAGNRMNDVTKAYENIRSVIVDLDMNQKRIVREIEASFGNLVQTLQRKKEALLRKASCIVHKKKDVLTEQIKYLCESESKFLSIQRNLKNHPDDATVIEKLKLHSLIDSTMKHLESVQSYLVPHEDGEISFQGPEKSLVDDLALIGLVDSQGYAKDTYAFGINMHKAIVGTTCHISVQSVGHSGDKRTVGGDKIKAVMTYKNKTTEELQVCDHNSGLYTITFFVKDFEPPTIHVTLRNQAIRDSPFKPEIRRLRQYNDLQFSTSKFGIEENDANSIKRPWGLHCDKDGYIYATDRSNNRIHVYNPDGSLHHIFGSTGSLPGQLYRPAGITVDVNRRVIVADKDNHRIQIFSFEGKLLKYFGQKGTAVGEFYYPWGIDCDSNGRIIVADTRNRRVQLFHSSGRFLNSFGYNSFTVWKDLDNPRGVCFGPSGKIYVTDFNTHRVLIIDEDFNKNTVIQFGFQGEEPHNFFRPQGIAIDHYGNLVIVDNRNNRICVYTPGGTYICSFGTGIGSSQSVNTKEIVLPNPQDITLSNDGFVFVVDLDLNCIVKF